MKKRKYLSVIISLMTSSLIFLWVITDRWLSDGIEPLAQGNNAYAIVLGAKVDSLSLQYRLEAAVNYAEQYPETILVLSGGQGPDESISEAKAMKSFLRQAGIANDRLLLEDRSTSTYENFLFSSMLIPEEITSLTVITSDYHLARAKKIALDLGIQTDVVPAKTPDIVKLKVRTRERLALLKTYLLGK